MKIFSDIVKDYTSTAGERNEVDDAMVLLLFTQTLLGQQVLNPKWRISGTIYKYIFFVCLILYVVLGTADFLKTVTNMAIKSEAYYTILMLSICVVKFCLFIYNREYFRNAYLISKSILFSIIKKISEEKAADLINKLKIILKLFYLSILVPISMYMLTAIWFNIHGERITLSRTTSTLMPMTSPYYEISFVLHATFLNLVALTFCAFDLWFVILMYFFCVTCDCLVLSLQEEAKADEETDLSYAKRLNDKLRIFYIDHENLMRYLNILNEMYKWASVVPLVSVVFAFCLLMLAMSEQIEWAFLGNFLPIISEIFAYNWFGEQVKHKTMKLKIAVIEFDWSSMTLADKKNYLIIITYMRKEFSIKTAFGNDLSLNTMTDVLKASYQAFTIFRTVEV